MAREEAALGAAGLTQILQAATNGDPQSLNRLADAVYHDLRRVCASQMKGEGADGAFAKAKQQFLVQPTDIVHDVYLRLVDQKQMNWKNRAHFFAIAARLVRRVLVDQARAAARLKRGGDASKVPLSTSIHCSDQQEMNLLELEDSLARLGKLDPVSARVVELRIFAELTDKAIAHVLEMSDRTVRRHLAFGRAWLYRDVYGGTESAGPAPPGLESTG